MLTEAGYAELAYDAQVAAVLAAVEQVAYPPAHDPRVAELEAFFHRVADGQDSPDGFCTLRPLDLLLMINRLMELHVMTEDQARFAPYLDVGQAIYPMVDHPRVATEFLILHARYTLLDLDPTQAYTLAHKASELARAGALPLHEGSALLIASRGQISLGQYSGAHAYLEQAKHAAASAGSPPLAFEVVLQQGALAMLTGHLQLALNYAQAALALANEQADPSAQVRAQVLVILADKQPGDELSDLDQFRGAREAFARGGDPVLYLTLLDYLGEAFLVQGDHDQACELTRELMTIAPRVNQHAMYLRALNRRGRILLKDNHCYQAAGILEPAWRLAVQLQFGEEANALKTLLGLARFQAGITLALRGGPETNADARALASQGLAQIVRAAGQAAEENWPVQQMCAELRLIQAASRLVALNDASVHDLAGGLPVMLRAEHPSGPEPPEISQAGIRTWVTKHLTLVKNSPLVDKHVMLKVIVSQIAQDLE